jgi:hypothetical protein
VLGEDLTALAARRGYAGAIPPVLDRIPDDDWVDEAFLEWGGLYRSPETMDIILERWGRSDSFYRFPVVHVIGRMRLPESETHLLRLLEGERDQNTREVICWELAILFSEAAIGPMIEQARVELEDWPVVHVYEVLLPLADALGVKLPAEADEWRRKREKGEARRRWFETGEGPVPEDVARERAGAARHRELQEVMRNPGPKVGRNQPCPCGSGKKYKRCCGRK